ncbi:OPT family oligopeptide transporter [Acidobacteriota bacterium]
MSRNAANQEPYIGPEKTLPEITIKALLLGVLLSAVLAGANAYLGLKVGMTVSASIPAAVISMGVLRLFRRSNILENNIVQTAASAGESLAAGVIFTLPALLLLTYWTDFHYLQTMAIACVGGILGVLFTIPLRRALIIEANLKFPEGVATGEVLKAGTEGGRGVNLIFQAGLGAGLLKLGQTGMKLLAGSKGSAVTAGTAVFGFGTDFSVALLGVGFIVGINIAVLVFAGGCISWIIGIPLYSAINGIPEGFTGYDAAYEIWSEKIRYLGVGAMMVGGLWAVVSLVKPVRDGLRSSFKALKTMRSGEASAVPRTEQDTPINIVLILLAVSILPLFLVTRFLIDQTRLGIGLGPYAGIIVFSIAFALVAGFLFSCVAGYMAGLVGSSNNPISGVTIATVLTASLAILALMSTAMDFDDVTADGKLTAAAAAILVGGIVCCAAAIAGDNMQDLKAGRIVGATPWRQQIMQMVGVLAAAVILPPVLSILYNAYGIKGLGEEFLPRPDMDPAEMLKAPQATLMQSVARGVFEKDLEWLMIGIGCLIAVVIIIVDQILKARKSNFRTPVLAVAVGIYLPLELTVPIFVGGMVAWYVKRNLLHQRDELGDGYEKAVSRMEKRGLLFSSGLITGEALVGIFLAIPFAIKQSTDVMRIIPNTVIGLPTVLSIACMILVVNWLIETVQDPRD